MQEVVESVRWDEESQYITMSGKLYNTPLNGYKAAVTDGNVGWRSALNEASDVRVGLLSPRC